VIIGFCNEKGGVSKTTLAVHAATWLARQGRRVALVDLDTQAGVSHFLGIDPADDVAELLRAALFLREDRRPPITSFLLQCPRYDNLVLLRGCDATGEVEADLHQPNRPRPGTVLTQALGPLTEQGVIVVVDTGPYAGKLQEGVLDAADHVFVPGKPEGATEAAILKVAVHLKALGRSITGLIPTLYDVCSKKHADTVADWKGLNGLGRLVYHDTRRALLGLPQRVVWGQLYRVARPIWDVTPGDVACDRSTLDVATREMAMILRRLEFDVGLSRRNPYG
jgi:cellulose biosynthesis protein BcsQ